MTDHDALVRAICDFPDDDTPRLVYADFLDDHGEPDRAAFVRAQVELARTPAWEPFAVLCRHRRPEWGEEGRPFRHFLPLLPAIWNLNWHDRAFRRGFGWRVRVGSLMAWKVLAPRLADEAPFGALHLRVPATLDDWRAFAAGDWMRRVREIHLEAGSPVEPVRALCGSPVAAGVTDLHFDVSTSAGLPVLVEDVRHTPLGRGLRRLSFRLGEHLWLDDLLGVLALPGWSVDSLRLEVMGLTGDLVRRWCGAGGAARLGELDLTDNYALGNDGVRALAAGLRGPAGLHTLVLAGVGMARDGAKALADCPGLAGVRRLDLSRNTFPPAAVAALAGSEAIAGVRALNLAKCQLGDQAVRRLVRGRFWANLVELDLRDNPVSDPGARQLLRTTPSPDLTALLLDGARLGAATRAALRQHFGERVILDG